MALKQTIEQFKSGVHNLLPDEQIPGDAASDSENWLTIDGHIELARGRQLVGSAGGSGKVYGEHFGYKADGSTVHFRKIGTKIQYFNGTTWVDVITGLSEADYVFSNYSSLAGAFVYITGPDGLFKICTANPASYATLYSAAKNFKGYGIIDRARMILWGRAEDPSGLYGSYIDAQNSTVYTTVSGEATTSLAGTLAFKAGGATRTCFGVTITLTGSGEVYTDDFNGVLTGSLGGTGTINYMTGDYTLSNAGVGTAGYQWEDSNAKGVTDFTKSATRLAGEGFVIRQDVGGDAIQNVLVQDGAYFSMKKHSCYKLELDAEDTAPINEVFRTNIGIKTLRSAFSTGIGIVFINTANPSKTTVEILARNPLGDNFDVRQLFPHFAFENYTFDDAMVFGWDDYVVISCAENADNNNILLLCNTRLGTVDITTYGIRAATQDAGILYGGDSVSESTYEIFTGFDDMGIALSNEWISSGERFGDDVLKKVKRLRVKGQIDPAQSIEVYVSVDDDDFQWVGTILGTGSYVDYASTHAIGTSMVGVDTLGGGATTSVYSFLAELKVRLPKFRKRKIRLVAPGIGYVRVDSVTDFDIWTYQDKLPAKYRSKQNVSLEGVEDQDTPDF